MAQFKVVIEVPHYWYADVAIDAENPREALRAAQERYHSGDLDVAWATDSEPEYANASFQLEEVQLALP